jgi:hypothetical protein
MIRLQIVYSAIVALCLDSIYLKSLQYPHHLIGDPLTVALAVAASGWFIASLRLLRHRVWAYGICICVHTAILLGSGIMIHRAVDTTHYSEAGWRVVGLLFWTPFAVISGAFLYQLVVRRKSVLGKDTLGSDSPKSTLQP